MKTNHRLLLAIIIALPITGFSLTLEEAIQEVVKNNPEIKAEINNFRATQQDRNIAFAGYLPTVDLTAAAGREESNNNTTGFEDKYLNRTELQIILNLNLYRGGYDLANVSRQEARIKAAASSVMETINEKSLETAQLYLAAIKQRDLLTLAQQNVETHERVQEQIQKRIDTGIGAKSELEQASSRLALSYSNLIVIQNNYEDAKVNFEEVYGATLDPNAMEEPDDASMVVSEASKLLSKSLNANPSLKVQQSNIDVAKKNNEVRKAAYHPRIDLELSQQWNENINGLDADNDSRKYMLRFSYNLYSGGADQAAIEQSIVEIAKETNTLAMMKRQVKERFKLAWNSYSFIKQQLEYLEKHRDLSKQTLDLYNEEFSLGRRTLLDILDTEEEYYSAQRQITAAKYDHVLAKYRIMEATGDLLKVSSSDQLVLK